MALLLSETISLNIEPVHKELFTDRTIDLSNSPMMNKSEVEVGGILLDVEKCSRN